MPKADLADILDIIAAGRASQPKRTFEELGRELGLNKGTVWRIHRQGHVPRPRTLHRIGTIKYPRRYRLIAQVSRDLYNRVKDAAAADGVTMAEWMRQAVDFSLNETKPANDFSGSEKVSEVEP